MYNFYFMALFRKTGSNGTMTERLGKAPTKTIYSPGLNVTLAKEPVMGAISIITLSSLSVMTGTSGGAEDALFLSFSCQTF